MSRPTAPDIVGASCLSHDAALAVVRDDEIVYAAHSERFSRQKMDRYLCDGLLDDVEAHVRIPFEIAYYENQNLKRSRELFAGQYRRLLTTPALAAIWRGSPCCEDGLSRLMVIISPMRAAAISPRLSGMPASSS